MQQYPININIRGKKVLVVGGGNVAFRKIKRLIKSGSRIKLVSPELNDRLKSFLTSEGIDIEYYPRKFKDDDLTDIFLTVVATDSKKVNRRIAKLAKVKNILVNVVDDSELSDFTLPAVLERGSLLITFSTGGSFPALARRLREDFEEEIGNEYVVFLDIMKKIRKKILNEVDEPEKRRKILYKLADRNIIEKIAKDRENAVSDIEEILFDEFNI